MLRFICVIGLTASGKSYFIQHSFHDGEYEFLNIYDRQRQLFEEKGCKDLIPIGQQHRILYQANQLLQEEMIEKLSQGKSLVVEHTLFRAKRRIAILDEVKKRFPDLSAEVYFMRPSEERWLTYIAERGLEAKRILADSQVFEMPNLAEGWDHIYQVTDGSTTERFDAPTPEIVGPAREELRLETETFQREEKERQERQELINSMNERPFWHYCECCGKKELLTAQQAFDQGWDYPPKMGMFGLLGPRTCGDCGLQDTLFWRIHQQSLPIVIEKELSPQDLITWRRIKNEPDSLLETEDEIHPRW